MSILLTEDEVNSIYEHMMATANENEVIRDAFAKSIQIALIEKLRKEPAARLLHRKGNPLQEYNRTVARTYEECTLNAYPDGWIEGDCLYRLPTPQELEKE